MNEIKVMISGHEIFKAPILRDKILSHIYSNTIRREKHYNSPPIDIFSQNKLVNFGNKMFCTQPIFKSNVDR